MKKLVILEDSVIRDLLKRTEVLNEFPFLRGAAARMGTVKKSGCKPCQAKKNRMNVGDFSNIKAAIGQLPADRKAKFKQLIGAEQVRVYFIDAQRRKVKLTF